MAAVATTPQPGPQRGTLQRLPLPARPLHCTVARPAQASKHGEMKRLKFAAMSADGLLWDKARAGTLLTAPVGSSATTAYEMLQAALKKGSGLGCTGLGPHQRICRPEGYSGLFRAIQGL